MATTYTQRTFAETDRAKQAWKSLEDVLSGKPGAYDSRWLSQLDGVLSQLLNRPAFQYDPQSDPLYRQQQDNYVNLGRMAMMDTMGQAAALTGGYGNSYAQLAGQQAYNQSLQGLNDVIPELYQLALESYDRQSQSLLNAYGLLSDREALDYGRYQDAYGLWADQRNFLADRYDAERGYDYTQFRDLVGDDQWLAEFQEDIRRFDYANGLGEFAPSAAAGSSGGGSGSSTRTVRKKKEEEDEDPPAAPTIHKSSVVTDRTKPGLRTKESF